MPYAVIAATRNKQCTDCKEDTVVLTVTQSLFTLEVVSECQTCKLQYTTTFKTDKKVEIR